ncbi:NAD-dependent epimerase/dehydratase family protein [Phaeovibrio sulfidiphilus]|uniref:NAD-dependent epimerase/dehydratase family protein n=1 Tax=Phaeovibrio sulfidiphilus TaxID=1220600 RepID=A0A8J7CC28_9PROT|nr:hopanoid-associated sugar epimerase [Phaeovibrio sulfidiphilus]MBE1236828.1 NAD-dependent epimerase/dehydratase family protein [Phaeovibrio sulfidiphilus]
MTVLVTGASGFVGAAVVRSLLARGESVRALVRSSSPRTNLDGLDVETVQGDLTDAASLRAATRGISALYHVAADYRLWCLHPEEMMRANVDGSVNIIRAALDGGASRVVYTSSVAVLKPGTDGSVADETTPTTAADMIGPYKLSKFLAEEAVRGLVVREGAPVVIVNPSTPIGPRDVRPTPTGRTIVEAALGKMPAVVDTGLNVVHVDDVAAGHLLAFDRGQVGERYILGGDDMTLLALVSEVCRLAGRTPPRLVVPQGLIMPVAWVVETLARLRRQEREPFVTLDGVRMSRYKMFFSSAKARSALGYAPRPASEALRDAVTWFRENGYLGG